MARALLWGSSYSCSLVVGLTIVAICTWANTIGVADPAVAQKVGIDPAVVSAPLITTLVDATGLAIYLLIAKVLLGAVNHVRHRIKAVKKFHFGCPGQISECDRLCAR